jgi:tetrapyrrole methylase family protein/MazG family protein
MYAMNLDMILAALEIETGSTMVLFDARTALGAHVPRFPPDLPALLINVDNQEIAAAVKKVLASVYPETHILRSVSAALGSAPRILEFSLGEFPGAELPDAVFVPPLPEGTSFEKFQEVIAHLRAPNGCPWDREQTHLSLRKHLLEESYETLSAMDAGDAPMMREEFGDLMLQVVLNAQIASEANAFRMGDVLQGIHDKIVRRHPHVFGELELPGVEQVLQNWERLKADERKASGDGTRGLLDGLPLALPALTQAQEYQARASRVGFSWAELEDVLDKVREEIDEVRRTDAPGALSAELGDLLFALANLARWKDVDAEAALRESNGRFRRRFEFVESGARQQGLSPSQLSADEMVSLWDAAKRQGL